MDVLSGREYLFESEILHIIVWIKINWQTQGKSHICQKKHPGKNDQHKAEEEGHSLV